MSDTDHKQEDTYSAEQTEARAEMTLRRLLTTPPKLHKDSKLGVKREPKPKLRKATP